MKQLYALAEAFSISESTLKKYWYADKIVELMKEDYDMYTDVMVAAEDRISYLRSQRSDAEQLRYSPTVQDLLQKIDNAQTRWQKLRPIEGIHLERLKEYFRTSYTYESNKIEGNTLNLQETELVINQGLTISGKSMTEHLEAINHSEATTLLYELVRDRVSLSERLLLELHNLILRGIDRQHAGRYRLSNVRISGSRHIPPDHLQVTDLMRGYFAFYQRHRVSLHPVVLAAEMHERLVSIHPFIDGNGRTARLVMNLILMSHGYTMVILKGDHQSRIKYYQSLEKAQVDNDSDDFHQLICEAAQESLGEHLHWVE